jgi:uncharacterized protein YndB with AHSA1/START domain
VRAYEFRQYIARPPHDVWNALVNLDLAPRWRPLVKRMETVDGAPVHAGSAVSVTIEVFGKVRTTTSTTVEFEPFRRWTLRSSSNPQMEGLYAFALAPDRAGTMVTATCELKAHAFLAWLFMPLIGRTERRMRVELLPNLKRFVEEQG